MVPNNVLGVFIFTKRRAETIRMPLRSSAYDDSKRTG
jgi:hypothetical protein